MLIWRESAHQNWWNYSSPNTTASCCLSNQMHGFCLTYFDSCCTRCCCYWYCYCYYCWCCWCCYCCHCRQRSVDSFPYASEDQHNHSHTRFYYYTNKTGLQHKIYIFFFRIMKPMGIFRLEFIYTFVDGCFIDQSRQNETIKFPKKNRLIHIPVTTLLTRKTLQVINISLCTHHHFKCWNQFIARWTMACVAVQSTNNTEETCLFWISLTRYFWISTVFIWEFSAFIRELARFLSKFNSKFLMI